MNQIDAFLKRNLHKNISITDNGIKNMLDMQNLNLRHNEKITDKQRKLMTDEFKISQSDSRTIAIITRIKELINGKFD